MSSAPSSTTDIAIIGMAALFPGSKDLSSYWQNILDKTNAIQDAPDEWALPYYDPNSQANDRIYTRKGGFLGNLAEFNPVEFGIMPNSVDGGEPDHFLALKVAWEALKDSGYLQRPFDRQKAGIILGRGTYINRGFATLLQHGQIVDQTMDLLQQINPGLDSAMLETIRQQLKASLPPFTTEMAPGLVPNVLTGRIANRLDLMGPNYIVDAACASSLIATQLAIQELVSGRCDLVLTGGVHASTPPQINMIFCQLGALGRDRIAPFDTSAAGTLLGEGLGIVVLKRLPDAERDGDRIYALIKGVGVASDGKALGLLAPRKEGEILALERAYSASGVDPATVELVEAHGTGIPLGDRTELQSLTQVFGQRQSNFPTCALGSVKSMIGHCLPAAGAASMIKVALSLYHKVLPPTLCEQVNPALQIEQTPFYINTEARPWIHSNTEAPRRAGVNAFGFGGINAHAVLEEYRSPSQHASQRLHQFPTELLIFSADQWEELVVQINRSRELLQRNPQLSLADLSYTLAMQPLGNHRLAIVAKTKADLDRKLNDVMQTWQKSPAKRLQMRNGIYYDTLNGTPPRKPAFLFPGEGSQYQNMLADLCVHFPQIQTWFDFLDATLAKRRSSLPSQIIFPPPTGLTADECTLANQQLFNMDVGSETVFTASMALYEMLRDFGIESDVIVGHSTGENTALVASGIIRLASKAELMSKILHLNQLYLDLEMAEGIPKGELAAVGAVATDRLNSVLADFGGRIHLAMDNCPNQVVLFGSAEDLAMVTQRLKDLGAICSRLPFDRAYHTPLFAPVGAVFRAFYDELAVGTGHTRVYSCAIAAPFPTDAAGIRTLATQQWSSRVRFRETILRLYEEGVRAFIEVGPSGNLTSFVTDILAGREHLAMASNIQKRTGLEQLQHLLGRLLVKGHPINFGPLYRDRPVRLIDFDTALNAPKATKPQPVLSSKMPIMRLALDGIQSLQSHTAPAIPYTAAVSDLSSALVSIESDPASADPPVSIESAMQGSAQSIAQSSDFGISSTVDDCNNSEAAVFSTASVIVDSAVFSQTVPRSQGQHRLMTTYFQLMQEFLGNQARVTAEIYSHLMNVSSIASAASALIVSEKAHTLLDFYPLLGTVLEQDEQHLYCERCFELGQDLFLHDHTIGGAPSERHPELLPLPVIPFTVSMEILAEAAAYLVGGDRVVVGMSQLRGYRWLSLDQGHLTLGISATIQPQPDPDTWQVQVRLLQSSSSNPAQRHLVFEGLVSVAPQFACPPAPMSFNLAQPAPSRWTDAELYSTGMFHGPRFQGVKHIRRWGQEGIEADLKVISIGHFFQAIAQPVFQIDAGLLDAGGQLVGYWVSEQFGSDFNVFPFQVQAFHQYGKPLPGDTLVCCRGLIRFIEDRQAVACFDFLDNRGHLIARLEGWQDRCFSAPTHYYQCRMQPQTAYLSQPWLQSETSLVIRRIDPFPEGFLSDAWGIWQRVLAHLVLNQAEREFWYQLPENGCRRVDWLLGRIAAKDAVRQWAAQTLNLQLAPIDIEISATPLGQPIVICAPLKVLGLVPQVSISHSLSHVVAVLSPPGTLIGIDLQRLEKLRADDLLSAAVTAQELTYLELLPDVERQSTLVRFWCAKEAAAKALGIGLGGNPQRWKICAYAPERREVNVLYNSKTLLVNLWWFEQEILAICQHPNSGIST